MMISVCGLKCDECEHFGKSCQGCINVKGETFWAKEMMPDKTCPLYACAVKRNSFRSCGDCKSLPCNLFLEMKDPNSTEEEHQKSIALRVSILRSMN